MSPVCPSTPLNLPETPPPSPPADSLELTYVTDKMLYDKKSNRLWVKNGSMPVCKAWGRHITCEIFEKMLAKKTVG